MSGKTVDLTLFQTGFRVTANKHNLRQFVILHTFITANHTVYRQEKISNTHIYEISETFYLFRHNVASVVRWLAVTDHDVSF